MNEKIYDVLDTGGERILLHWTTYEPGVVPGNPKWEIPVSGVWDVQHATVTGNPMGDAKMDDLRVGFDSRLKLKFVGSKVTSEEGSVGLPRTGRSAQSYGNGCRGANRFSPGHE